MDSGANAGRSSGMGMGGFFLGMLIGAVVGGVTALMLAPKSGAETREMIKNRFNQMKDVACSSAQDVKQHIQEMK